MTVIILGVLFFLKFFFTVIVYFFQGEGEEITENFPILISHKLANAFTSKSIDITYPPKTVPNSQKIRVVAAGKNFSIFECAPFFFSY